MPAMMHVRELLEASQLPPARAAELLDERNPAGDCAVMEDSAGHQEITYGELREQSARFAAALTTLGVHPGDRVATLMEPSLEMLLALLGLSQLGAQAYPVSTDLGPDAVIGEVADSAARLVICDAGHRRKLVPAGGVPNDASPLVVVARGEAFGFDSSFAEMVQGVGPFSAAGSLEKFPGIG